MNAWRAANLLLLKNLIFTIVVPGTVTVFLPYLVLSQGPQAAPESWGASQYLALLPMGLGAAIYLRCVWDFAVIGHGTPAPIDPPRELVVRGLYRYVRNPMYLGVLMILLGEAVFFESRPLLQYAAGFLVVVHLFVVLLEEPILRRKFGEPYQRYCRLVRRWWPGRGYREGQRAPL